MYCGTRWSEVYFEGAWSEWSCRAYFGSCTTSLPPGPSVNHNTTPSCVVSGRLDSVMLHHPKTTWNCPITQFLKGPCFRKCGAAPPRLGKCEAGTNCMKPMQQHARGIRRHSSKTAAAAIDEQRNGLMEESQNLAVSDTQRHRNLAGPNPRSCSKGRLLVSGDWAMG
jgi:hypothetical protein